ncbi:sensor histidine kinase [Desulforhopalus singaporensis]|uniref:histidine kinase n=1 Tax=Desulforhopalus singaporensis TaxID=91360 RepID=A0A1H0SXA8_9BACT|nr:PAS domain-containing sensor histidine kinase [Desulforhopalus singaporensis]SDP46255.1 two-component system, NtrC family, sensor kinase [Desulforhopalus singaporensis]
MKKQDAFFEKFLPKSLKSLIDPGSGKRNYKLLRAILAVTMLAISIGPVLIVAGLGYRNYGDLVLKAEDQQLEWQLDGKVKSIKHMVKNLRSVVQFTARRDRYTELIEGDSLENLFLRLKQQYPFFADLGVIDETGIQQAYVGPYELQGANYQEEKWFGEVSDRGVYISEVYTGYRQVPHFAIAVSNYDPKTRQVWTLRATIDASTLQQFVNTIKTNASDDLFLINNQGVLQTSSAYYGDTLSQFSAPSFYGIQHDISLEGEYIFRAILQIEDTPWALVLIKKRFIHQADWKNFQDKLSLIVMACIVLSVLVICLLVSLLTGLISKVDDLQIAMLKEAEHTDKLASIGRLAAGVGHEINNPLAIIDQKTGLIDDLLQMSGEFEHKAMINNSVKVINQSVERCKIITHRLLGFARRTDIASEWLRINTIVSEVLQFLDNALLYSRIKVDLQLQDDLPRIMSDRMQLQQIFLNIINNAIDAIGKDGVINIITHKIAGDIRVVIQDDGPGIPEEVLPHIFEPFYTTKETGKGTGLGLSITYGLIKRLGGDITVRSHVGTGTAFTITLPIHNEAQNDRRQ